MTPGTMTDEITEWNDSRTKKPVGPHKQCFNCWTSGCPVTFCEMPKEKAQIKRNFKSWKQLRGLLEMMIHYLDLAVPEKKSNEANEAFISRVTVDET